MSSTAMLNYLQSRGISQNKSHPGYKVSISIYCAFFKYKYVHTCISCFRQKAVSQDAPYSIAHMVILYAI